MSLQETRSLSRESGSPLGAHGVLCSRAAVVPGPAAGSGGGRFLRVGLHLSPRGALVLVHGGLWRRRDVEPVCYCGPGVPVPADSRRAGWLLTTRRGWSAPAHFPTSWTRLFFPDGDSRHAWWPAWARWLPQRLGLCVSTWQLLPQPNPGPDDLEAPPALTVSPPAR